jgi:hypothetical protein
MNHISLGWNFSSSAPQGLEELALVYYDEAKRQINSVAKRLFSSVSSRCDLSDFLIAAKPIAV